jgi:hypothetical protein
LMFLGIFQLLIFNFMTGVMPVILDNTAQSSDMCQFVCLDLVCKETL